MVGGKYIRKMMLELPVGAGAMSSIKIKGKIEEEG